MEKKILLFMMTLVVIMLMLILLLWGGRQLNDTIFRIWSKYNSIDHKVLIKEIEDVYSITFPQDISNVIAGKTGTSWDGGQSFILKFEMQSDHWEELYSIGRVSLLMDYRGGLDRRLEKKYYPAWFTVPVVKGKIFDIGVKKKDIPNATYHFKVYVDTANDEKAIVYMSGIL